MGFPPKTGANGQGRMGGINASCDRGRADDVVFCYKEMAAQPMDILVIFRVWYLLRRPDSTPIRNMKNKNAK